MDPVSQAAAIEAFERQSLTAVGWYHSHPTFAPNPSLQDLETQSTYQTLFAGRPFVGVIVSPFYTKGETVFRWLETSDELDPSERFRTGFSSHSFLHRTHDGLIVIPRQLDRKLVPKALAATETHAAITNLYSLYRNYPQYERRFADFPLFLRSLVGLICLTRTIIGRTWTSSSRPSPFTCTPPTRLHAPHSSRNSAKP